MLADGTSQEVTRALESGQALYSQFYLDGRQQMFKLCHSDICAAGVGQGTGTIPDLQTNGNFDTKCSTVRAERIVCNILC